MPSRLLSWSAIASAIAICLPSCGGADRTVVPGPEEAGAESTEFKSGVNICPLLLDSLVMPTVISPEASAFITVRATDPDASDSDLILEWSAPSGTFSAYDKAATTFRCSELGAVPLTITAIDRAGCKSALTLHIDCVAN